MKINKMSPEVKIVKTLISFEICAACSLTDICELPPGSSFGFAGTFVGVSGGGGVNPAEN